MIYFDELYKGMAIHLVNEKDEDIIQLFQEILHLDENTSVSQIVLPIKLIVMNRFREVLKKSFRAEEISFIDANKNKATTSIFAVFQQFRVECDLDLFFRNLRQVLAQESTRKFSNDDSEDDYSSSNCNAGNANAFLKNVCQNQQEELIQESNVISPIDQSIAIYFCKISNQHFLQDSQPSFSNQQNYYLLNQNDNSFTPKQMQQGEQIYPNTQIKVVVSEPVDPVMPSSQTEKTNTKKSGFISLQNAISDSEAQFRSAGSLESSDVSCRKRLRTESLQVDTNSKFSPKNKRATQRSLSPQKSEGNAQEQEQDSQMNFSKSVKSQGKETSTPFGLINLKKLQQIDVRVENTGQNVQDNDLNEILSNEINEFYCSYIYNENDRIFDEIINLSSTSVNPLGKKVLEVFSILYQVNDLDVVDVVEDYKKDRNLAGTKERLIEIANTKKRSSYSSINSVNNKIGKFNLFKKLLRQIENFYSSEKVDFQVQQYLFLHDDVVTLSAFESYCINKNWKEFVENLVLIEKMSLIKFDLNKTEISKLNLAVLEQLQIIYEYGRFLRIEQKKDLEKAIKQGSDQILKIASQYDAEDITQQEFLDGITRFSQDISQSLRKDEYTWLQKYSYPSIEEREELKRVVEQFRSELQERDMVNLDILFSLIATANKSMMSALALFDYNSDEEDFLENLALIYHNEIANDMKRLIQEFARVQKWDQFQVKLLEQKVDDDEAALMAAYYHFKKNETDKDERQELRETFEIYLNLNLKTQISAQDISQGGLVSA